MTPSEELDTQDLRQDKETPESTTNTDEQRSASANSSKNTFRVKQVSEINENADDVICGVSSLGNSQNNGKRKLPSWMVTSNDIPESEDCNTNSKRLKSSESDLNADCPSTSEEQTDSADSPSSTSSKQTAEVTAEPLNNSPSSTSSKQTAEVAAKPLNNSPSTSSSKQTTDVKAEPLDNTHEIADPVSSAAQQSTSNSVDIKPAVSVKKEEATSTSRESCKFGIRCYRRNPMHRIEEAHPGDPDYKRPTFPTPPKGTPDCPYGDSCYRRNPNHFQQFYHPPETDFEQNWKNYRMRLRQRRQAPNYSTTNDDNSDLDDYDLEDPFIDDGDDEDYVPSDDDENADYDDCDKAED